MPTPAETPWIEWAKLILSPQLVIGVVTLFFLIYFRNELRNFMPPGHPSGEVPGSDGKSLLLVARDCTVQAVIRPLYAGCCG
jgi:hypothetical protein